MKEGAIRQPEGDPTPTVAEAAFIRDKMAVQQALLEMEVAINERPRGSNIAVNQEGEYYRFKTLPTWIPKELRDGNLLDRVMKNISEGKKPRVNATNEQQLQEIVEGHISDRIEELKNADQSTEAGVFSNDIAFAIALMVGGTYYLQSNDGTVAPVVAMGAMLANPKIAKRVGQSDLDRKFRTQQKTKNLNDAEEFVKGDKVTYNGKEYTFVKNYGTSGDKLLIEDTYGNQTPVLPNQIKKAQMESVWKNMECHTDQQRQEQRQMISQKVEK